MYHTGSVFDGRKILDEVVLAHKVVVLDWDDVLEGEILGAVA